MADSQDINAYYGAAREFHVGHLPKPKFAATTGPLDRSEITHAPLQSLSVKNLQAPPVQNAGLFEIPPPVSHYVLKYSRVEEYHHNKN